MILTRKENFLRLLQDSDILKLKLNSEAIMKHLCDYNPYYADLQKILLVVCKDSGPHTRLYIKSMLI